MSDYKFYWNPSPWRKLLIKLENLWNRWRIIDTWKYQLILKSDLKRYFCLSPEEYEVVQKIKKEKGDISYHFYPTGIGTTVRVKVKKTSEEIDITDYNYW